MRRFVTENCGILIVLILFTLAKLPTLAAPFWWDEAAAYIPLAVAVAQKALWNAQEKVDFTLKAR